MKPLSDKERKEMYKIRDKFLDSIRGFFDCHILTGDLKSIKKLVQVNRRFFDRYAKGLSKNQNPVKEV